MTFCKCAHLLCDGNLIQMPNIVLLLNFNNDISFITNSGALWHKRAQLTNIYGMREMREMREMPEDTFPTHFKQPTKKFKRFHRCYFESAAIWEAFKRIPNALNILTRSHRTPITLERTRNYDKSIHYHARKTQGTNRCDKLRHYLWRCASLLVILLLIASFFLSHFNRWFIRRGFCVVCHCSHRYTSSVIYVPLSLYCKTKSDICKGLIVRHKCEKYRSALSNKIWCEI